MFRKIFHLNCVTLFVLLALSSSHGQTLSSCQPSPPMPPNVKPGVVGLTLTRDGKTLVVAGGDAKIRFVEMATGQVQRVLAGHTNAVYIGVFSPDEKLLASSSRDQTARIWEVATGRELRKLDGFRCAVKTVEFSPDGQKLAASGNDGMLKIYDVKTGKELKSLVHINSADIDMSIYTLIFGRDSKKLYGGNGDGTISEWDVASGKETRVWKAQEGFTWKLVFSPDYKLLASIGDAAVKLWDTTTWREVRSLSLVRMPEAVVISTALAFSNDGKLIAASAIGLNQERTNYLYVESRVWNVNNGEKLFTAEGHKFDIPSVIFSRDDRFLLTGGVDTTIKFWDTKSGQLWRTFTMPPNEHKARGR